MDTSAVMAVILGEPEREAFRHVLRHSQACISVGSVIEATRVTQALLGQAKVDGVERLLNAMDVEICAVDAAQLALAKDGMLRFGKGRRARPAVLNFGDLFAYALARHLDAPLLYKGADFALTDVRSVSSWVAATPAGPPRAPAWCRPCRCPT